MAAGDENGTQRARELHDQIVNWLKSPAAYPHAVEQVEFLETHISCVFLAGPFVYKLKKPVRYDFLDFTTVEQREQACRDEVRLNQRLAPNVYLGVWPITRNARGEIALQGEGEVVDHVVRMRRLPTERTLDALLAQGALQPEQIDQLAERLAAFHATLPPLSLSPQEYRERIQTHVRGNGQQLLAAAHHLDRAQARRVQAFQLQLLLLRPQLFDERVRAHRILEGHGDLRPEHICFGDELAIFDCIEFNEEFRQLDVLDELAFLAAECDCLGAPWIGPRLLAHYYTQGVDSAPAVLFDFYKSYRAAVRAKVAALRADQLTGSARDQAAHDAARHLDFADQYAAPHARSLLLLVGGLSGSGKSTLARELATQFGAELLQSDVVRQTLYHPAIPASSAAASNVYTPQSRARVYEEMARQATALLFQGVSVVWDATFSNAGAWNAAINVAAQAKNNVLAIECRCSAEVARERIRERRARGGDASQATLEVFEAQRRSWEPWPAKAPQCQVDTEQPLPQQVAVVVAELSQRWT